MLGLAYDASYSYGLAFNRKTILIDATSLLLYKVFVEIDLVEAPVA